MMTPDNKKTGEWNKIEVRGNVYTKKDGEHIPAVDILLNGQVILKLNYNNTMTVAHEMIREIEKTRQGIELAHTGLFAIERANGYEGDFENFDGELKEVGKHGRDSDE